MAVYEVEFKNVNLSMYIDTESTEEFAARFALLQLSSANRIGNDNCDIDCNVWDVDIAEARLIEDD